ncbi:hypothetical protein JCM16303_000903 [Sporobolomyces ruberrimus]
MVCSQASPSCCSDEELIVLSTQASTPPPPPAQPHLPPELLYKIFAYLPELPTPAYPQLASSRSTLAVLCQTCSTFQSIAQPILWRFLDIRTRRDAEGVAATLTRDQKRAGQVHVLRLRTEQLLGPPNQMETSELVRQLDKLGELRVEQRWFGLDLLEGLQNLTHIFLLGPWSPSRSPAPATFTPLRQLRLLSITLHALCDLLNPEYEAHNSLVVFSNVSTLSLHEANVSLSSWLRPRLPPPSSNLLDNFPNLSLVSSLLAYSSELANLLPTSILTSADATPADEPNKTPISILWRIYWQSLVDYMPPWRSLGQSDPSNGPLPSIPIYSVVSHLAFAPFPYSPIPDHFLHELTNRIATDPSLHHLETLWLDIGWEHIGTREMREEWEEVLEMRQIRVEYVAMKGEGLGGWEGKVESRFIRTISPSLDKREQSVSWGR